MTVQVKYCGGCNPRYNRNELVGKIRKDFPGSAVIYEAPAGTVVDFVLVVCGCPVRCASHERLRGLFGKRIVSSPGEYPGVYKELCGVESKSEAVAEQR